MQMIAQNGALAPLPAEFPPPYWANPYPYAMHPSHPTMARVAFVPRSMLQAILDEENHGLPMFRNLTTMTFDDCEIGDNMEMLCRFMHNTPSIEKLTMQHCVVCLMYLLSCSALVSYYKCLLNFKWIA
jgi:hypothetical protein